MLSTLSPEVRIESNRLELKPVPGVKPREVGSTSRLETLNRELTFGNSVSSQSPPPQAIDIEWSAFLLPKPAAPATPTPSPPPPPPPFSLQDAITMMKLVEMHKLLSSEEENLNPKYDSSIRTVAASLRNVRVDWMSGHWIENITQAALAFHLWRQRSLSQRIASASIFVESAFIEHSYRS
jgi:hypothetical protein